MAIEALSGAATPSSVSATLVATPTADVKSLLFPTGSNILNRSASDLIELVASRDSISSAVYVYDVAEQIGFGTLTRTWASSLDHSAPAISLQTRAGAGLGLVGRLSQGTSQDAVNGSILTAYTTPAGLAAMAGSLTYLPPASSRSRLIVQVPAVTPVGDTFALSPTLASLSMLFNLLPDNVAVLLSATPQESVDLAMLAYKLNNSHVVHIFDHHSASREVGHNFMSDFLVKDVSGLTVPEAVRLAGYAPFEFVGDRSARTVFVLMNGQLALIAKALASRAEGVAVVIVRVLRPWDADELQKVVPSTAEEVYVFDDVPHETSQGPLFVDVFASLYDPCIHEHIVRAQRVTPDKAQEFISCPPQFAAHLASLIYQSSADLRLASNSSPKLLFLSTPSNNLSFFHQLVADTFSDAISTRRLTNHDIFSRAGGITADRIILSPKKGGDEFLPISVAFHLNNNGLTDFVCILEPNLLKSHTVLDHAKPGSPVLIITSWSSAELLNNLPSAVLELISQRRLRLYTIDAKLIASEPVTDSAVRGSAQSLILYLAFLRLYLGKASNEAVVRKIAQGVANGAFRDNAFAKISARTWAELLQIELPREAPTPVAEENTKAFPALKHFEFNAIAVDTGNGETVYNGFKVSSWHEAAKHLLFPSVFTPPLPTPLEADEFPQIPCLHPELPERTYLVTCTVNRRLTPLDYDRNVFHLEFDTEGTGLKYAIGEALGVYGWNDEQEVKSFCEWYGVDLNQLITIPISQGGDKMHTRTIFQALQQHIDLFGEPPKSFYTSLAPYATKPADKFALQFIGSPEGSSTFKKFNEKDTVTFAEVLQRYPSAKPGIETLCEMIGDTKPRHYSIASAQSVVGNRVDLLVVTVEWIAPSGERRYGQCTRYLAGLKVGQKVTVSIKPSVMKLPPDDKQPIIMAGLGTGAAPFRAFLQHRAWLSQKGIEVGPTYYYFGSRHQHQEYLYGEEIEAYILDDTITKAGLAFSRDGPRKVYIQHKMLEDAETLADMLKNKEGVFYLCGPTWPVPDVYEALVGALVKKQGMTRESAGEFLEGLKEEERYVLEVY
ncbi:assimilatory sulfite reductase [Gyrodon lividus]|nr:assimilatory sulfite reductase [Gyrodon lividus]